jgi:hypothetical protein
MSCATNRLSLRLDPADVHRSLVNSVLARIAALPTGPQAAPVVKIPCTVLSPPGWSIAETAAHNFPATSARAAAGVGGGGVGVGISGAAATNAHFVLSGQLLGVPRMPAGAAAVHLPMNASERSK